MYMQKNDANSWLYVWRRDPSEYSRGLKTVTLQIDFFFLYFNQFTLSIRLTDNI